MSQVTGLSITASDYPDSTSKVLSYMEAMGSIGMIAGPLIGALIFHLLGFVGTFIIYAAILFAIIPIFWVMIGPDRPYVKKEQTYKISVCSLDLKGLIFLQLIMLGSAWIGYMAFDAVLALYLEQQFGLDNAVIGLLFAVPLVSYIAAVMLIGAVQHKFSLYKVIATGGCILSLFSLITGPCTA